MFLDCARAVLKDGAREKWAHATESQKAKVVTEFVRRKDVLRGLYTLLFQPKASDEEDKRGKESGLQNSLLIEKLGFQTITDD